ncbi:hypothetical protein M9H77_23214 [Catharanthus roseus]|uniref:Uncharacterized protein n=1 Tax=Catharanthus roseus TaxID=4058 RepID=A0ACC0ATD9_CATRO|nr:hypothetical protein M9H77_23214 [Catharanthus roseus]
MPLPGSTDKVRIPQRGHQNQIPASGSQYQQNIIRALVTKQPHSHITGQNIRLQIPGAPTSLPWDQPQFRAPPYSPLGGRPTAEMIRCPHRPIGPRAPWYYAPLQVDPLSRV